MYALIPMALALKINFFWFGSVGCEMKKSLEFA